MNRSIASTLHVSALSLALAVSVFAGCDQDADGAPGGGTSESTVCRQGGSDLCGDGCAPSYEKIELGPDCCACKPTICEGVECAPPQCAPGETVALPSDSCCPACVPEVSSCSDDGDFICTAFTCADSSDRGGYDDQEHECDDDKHDQSGTDAGKHVCLLRLTKSASCGLKGVAKAAN